MNEIDALPGRQTYRELCVSIGGPAMLANDHEAAEKRFQEAKVRLGEQVNRIAWSGENGSAVEPGSIKHQLIMAVQ